MSSRITIIGTILLAALGCASPAAAAETCVEKKFPANAKVRSGDLNDLFGRIGQPEKPMRFVFVSAGGTRPEARRFGAGVETEAKRLGIALEARTSSGALGEAPDAVLLAAADAADWKSLIGEARAKGVPTIAVGARIEGARLSVAPDQSLFGAMAGEYLHELFPTGATLIQLSDATKTADSSARAGGFAQEIAYYPNLVLAGTLAADGTRDGARRATLAAMAAHPDAKGLYAGNDEMALGALEALKSLKLFEVAVVGTEGTIVGRDALTRRSIKGTVAHFPEKEGALAVQAALRLVACQQLPPWIVSPQVTLTPKSIEDMAPVSQ